MNVIALKTKMLEKNKKNKDLAFELGLSLSGFHRKMSGETEFTQSEIKTMMKVLHLSNDDVMLIFFDAKVSYKTL